MLDRPSELSSDYHVYEQQCVSGWVLIESNQSAVGRTNFAQSTSIGGQLVVGSDTVFMNVQLAVDGTISAGGGIIVCHGRLSAHTNVVVDGSLSCVGGMNVDCG